MIGSNNAWAAGYTGAGSRIAINYVDSNYIVNHDSDSMGDHGSHVAGITTANRFIPTSNGS